MIHTDQTIQILGLISNIGVHNNYENLSLRMTKPTIRLSTRSGTNEAAEPQKKLEA